MTPSLLAGIPISSRFAEKLGIAQEKQDQQQMTHTKASTQDDKSWDTTLYEKSDIYRSIKDAYTAPMRAWKGEIDPYSDQGVMEALNLAGVGLTGSIPGGARGPGSLGIVERPPHPDNITKLLTLPEKKLAAFAANFDQSVYKHLLDNLHEQAFQGYKAGQLTFDQSVEIHDKLLEKNKDRLKQLYKLWSSKIGTGKDKQTVPADIKEFPKKKDAPFTEISSPIEDLEASVKEQVKQLDITGWERLPGAAGKRDSDVQPTFLQKMYKEHPDLVRSKPSELEKLEIKLRRIYKLPEEEIEDIMLPLWSTYIRNQKPDDPVEEHTRKTKMKRWT